MTVSLKLAEPLVEAVKAKLILNMAARVATINDDASLPAITPALKPPATSDFFTSGLSLMPPNQPAFVIAEGAMEIVPDTEGPHSFIAATEVAVYILEADPDRQQLGKRLTRQARAVIESLWDSDPKEALVKADGSPLAYRLTPTRTAPGPVFDPDQETSFFRAWYLVTFLAEQLEG